MLAIKDLYLFTPELRIRIRRDPFSLELLDPDADPETLPNNFLRLRKHHQNYSFLKYFHICRLLILTVKDCSEVYK
jgi:hypothetical protein